MTKVSCFILDIMSFLINASIDETDNKTYEEDKATTKTQFFFHFFN